MWKMRANLLQLIGVIAVLAMVAAGCGGGGGGAAGKADLSDAEFTVGSKEFTEQLILGEITLQTLEAAGATVNDQIGLAGTVAARKALESGEIDMYWEYTGTGWITHLQHTDPVASSQKQYEAVAREDLEKNGIKWLTPAPADNTYGIAVRSEAHDELGVKDLSDFNRLINESPEQASLCVGTEFSTRDDGLPGLEKAYGYKFPRDDLIKIDEGLIYKATDQGDRCNFGEVFKTDGRIEALDLELIEDDQNFFAIYNPALNVRKEVYDENPELAKLFEPIAKKLDTQTLQKLNAQVDVEGQLPEEVAEQWLSENGFI